MVRYALRLFVDSDEAIYYGNLHGQTVALFFFLLAFSHCAAGVLRGCGKSVIPMVTMLAFWCGARIVYVTAALKVWPVFQTISWAYPLTWFLSSAVLLVCMLRTLQSLSLIHISTWCASPDWPTAPTCGWAMPRR